MIPREDIRQDNIMKHHNSGRASGLALVLILIVALVVAWLTVTQLGTIRRPQDSGAVQPTEDLVHQAQDAVDTLNERMGQSIEQH